MRQFLRFLRHWRTWLGLFLLVVMISIAIATPILAPQEDPAAPQNFQRIGSSSDLTPHPPNAKALLGTLSGQYDVLFTLLWGLRQAFQFGLSVMLITAVFGILFGATSAYLGGSANNVLMRLPDAFLTFPILAAIVFMRQIITIMLQGTDAFLMVGNP